MAGHSKWANIKHKKAASDAKRGKIWTRLIREITIAARISGAELAGNPRLRLAVEKATDANMPKDNIQRAIQRGIGGVDGSQYEEVRYEGYGPGGAALVIDALTDNRTRTVAEVRHAFNKYQGNLGQDGSVMFLFNHLGQFIFSPETVEEQLFDIAIESGAKDVIKHDDGSFEVICQPNDFIHLKNSFDLAHIKPEESLLTFLPLEERSINGEGGIQLQKMLDVLENLDDVQEIYTNTSITED